MTDVIVGLMARGLFCTLGRISMFQNEFQPVQLLRVMMDDICYFSFCGLWCSLLIWVNDKWFQKYQHNCENNNVLCFMSPGYVYTQTGHAWYCVLLLLLTFQSIITAKVFPYLPENMSLKLIYVNMYNTEVDAERLFFFKHFFKGYLSESWFVMTCRDIPRV